MGNTMAVNLVVRALNDEPAIGQRAAILDGVLRSLFSNHLAVYHRQYPLFANAKVMAAKVVWDFAYYWAVPAHLFFHEQLTNTTMFARNREVFNDVAALGQEMQELFRRWHALDADPYAGEYVDIPEMPLMDQLNSALMQQMTPQEAVYKLQENVNVLGEVAAELRDWLQGQYPMLSLADLTLIQQAESAGQDFLAPLWAGLLVGKASC